MLIFTPTPSLCNHLADSPPTPLHPRVNLVRLCPPRIETTPQHGSTRSYKRLRYSAGPGRPHELRARNEKKERLRSDRFSDMVQQLLQLCRKLGTALRRVLAGLTSFTIWPPRKQEPTIFSIRNPVSSSVRALVHALCGEVHKNLAGLGHPSLFRVGHVHLNLR